MTTTATKKQSEAIRQRMQEIRCELPYHMESARSDVSQYFDWKVHVRKHPIVAATLVAAVTYALVPRKQLPPPPVQRFERTRRALLGPSNEHVEQEVKKSTLLSGVVGSMLTLALRSGMTFATRRIAGHFAESLAHRPQSSTHGNQSSWHQESYR